MDPQVRVSESRDRDRDRDSDSDSDSEAPIESHIHTFLTLLMDSSCTLKQQLVDCHNKDKLIQQYHSRDQARDAMSISSEAIKSSVKASAHRYRTFA